MQTQGTDRVRDALSAVPNLGKLLIRLVRDPRVPKRNKLIFGGIAAYLFLPFDFIPDWVPGIGQMDDIVLVALGLDAMLNRVPEQVLADHWDGDEDVLETIRGILSTVTTFIPEKFKDRLFPSDGLDEE